ncbi:MAG: hypothetical protein AB1670_06125, partial [Pseudomonadota bacterium]
RLQKCEKSPDWFGAFCLHRRDELAPSSAFSALTLQFGQRTNAMLTQSIDGMADQSRLSAAVA